jgi:hypothetical protein
VGRTFNIIGYSVLQYKAVPYGREKKNENRCFQIHFFSMHSLSTRKRKSIFVFQNIFLDLKFHQKKTHFSGMVSTIPERCIHHSK